MQHIHLIRSGSFLNYIRGRADKARLARQQTLLRRELARLPRYVADDILYSGISVGPDLTSIASDLRTRAPYI